MRIDMTTRQWHELLKPVLPHAGTDAETPELNVVRIEVTDRAVYAVATDRYTLAAERQPRTDLGNVLQAVHLHAKEAKLSLSLFPHSKDADPKLRITIDTAPFPVTIVGEHRSINRLALTIESEDGTRLVLNDERDPAGDPLTAWRKRIGKLLARSHDGYPGPALTLSAGYLARWASAVRHGERLSVFTGQDGDMPILVTVENHFAGAWQPISYLTTPAEALADSPWLTELNGDMPDGHRIRDAVADAARAAGHEVTVDGHGIPTIHMDDALIDRHFDRVNASTADLEPDDD